MERSHQLWLHLTHLRTYSFIFSKVHSQEVVSVSGRCWGRDVPSCAISSFFSGHVTADDVSPFCPGKGQATQSEGQEDTSEAKDRERTQVFRRNGSKSSKGCYREYRFVISGLLITAWCWGQRHCKDCLKGGGVSPRYTPATFLVVISTSAQCLTKGDILLDWLLVSHALQILRVPLFFVFLVKKF